MRQTRFAFRQEFANAHDGGQARFKRRFHLAIDAFVRLPKILPAFGMADNYAAAAGLDQHAHRNRSREGTLAFPMSRLRGNRYGGAAR